MKKSLLSLLSIILIPLSHAQTADEAIHHLQNKRFDQALKILNGDLDKIATKELSADQLMLLRARAFAYSNQSQKVIDTVNELVAKHPKSQWIHKATFLKAQALADLKKHQEASAIYETQAEILFSPASKNAGALLLMKVAEIFSKEVNPEDAASQNKPKPDLKKAYTLLKEAYETGCSDTLKEKILFKKIKICTRMSEWDKVTSLSFLYLEKFDPDWKGKLGSIDRLTSITGASVQSKKQALIGKNRYTVRFHLAEALHRGNQRLLASRYLTELINDLRKANNPTQKNLLADSVWLRLMASRMVGGQPRNVRLWMSHAQEYLKNYPDHIHASNIIYSIGVIYQNTKQYDPAITAFQDFLNDKYQIKIVENPLTARPESKLEFNQRLKRANDRKEEASYRIGLIHLQNKQFDKAKEAWNTTSKAYPNGARWADCQRGLVDIHYQRSLHAVTGIAKDQTPEQKANARVEAEKALDHFIAAHPLDKRVPSLLYLIGNIHYIQANEIEKKLKNPEVGVEAYALTQDQNKALTLTLESWEKLITKYPSSPYASDAQYLTATIYENKTGQLDKAITAYRKSSHPNAKNRITALNSKKLIAFSNKNFTTAEKPFVQLSTRNIEKVTVRQYWLDIESYFRKGRKLENISSLDVDLVEADKTWEYTLPKYSKLQLLENKIDIPFPAEKPGICIIKIESKDYSTTTMVMRSDIDLAVRSSGLEMIAYAIDARTNKPAEGVKLLIADAGKVIATGITTEQGYFHLKDKKLADISDLRVLALSSTGAATCNYQNAANVHQNDLLPQIRSTSQPQIPAKAYFNQPKTQFLPGEILPISGIIRHEKDGTFIFPTKDQLAYTLTIRSNKKLLYKAPIQLQERGIFTHEYTLPDYLPSGAITLSLSPDFDKTAADFTHTVMVRKQSKDLVKLILDIDKTWINKGDTISGKITAKYRWGAPYANQKLFILLPNESQRLDVITDAKGEASFTYSPLFHNAGSTLLFRVRTTNNRYLSNYQQVLYDPIPFSILAASEHRSMSAGSISNIEIKTVNPDGKPISKQLNLEVIKIITVDADPILASTRAMEKVTKRFYKEEVLKTIPLTTDAKTGKIIHPLKLDVAGNYQLRVSAVGVSKYERTAIGRSSISVYDSTHSQKILIQQPATHDAKAGQIASLQTWSSLKKAVPALLTVETNTIIEKRIIQLEPGNTTIPIVLDARHCPSVQVHIMALSDRNLSTATQQLSVSNPLTIKSTLVKTTQEPDTKHTIKLQAFDSNENAVPADVFINLSQTDKPSKYNYASRHIYHHRVQAFIDPKNAPFQNASSTGLSHEGSQEAILTSVRDELERLNRAENDSIQRYSNNPILSQQHVQTIGKIRKLLYRAQSYYDQAQFDNAMREYKEILRLDPYNKSARRGMEKVNAAKSDYYRAAYDQTRAQMLMDVDSAWETAVPPTVPQITTGGQQVEYSGERNGSRNNISYGLSLYHYNGFTARNTFSTNASFIDRQKTPTEKSKTTVPLDGAIWTTVQRIPAQGKEFTIKANILEKPVHQIQFIQFIQFIGFSDTNASGISSESIHTPLPNIAKKISQKRLHGLPLSTKSNNELKAGENTIKLTLPEGANPVDLKLAIATSPSELLSEAVNSHLVSELGSMTPFHEKHPAGALLAHTAQLDFLIHHKRDIATQASLQLKINTLSSNLTISQKSDGSWTAVRNRNMSSLLHTAIAYQALCRAKEQEKEKGIEIEPSTLIKAKNWLNNQQKSVDTDLYNSRALVQYALSASGDADFATCNRLYRERKKMDNIGKAFLANTFILLDRKEFTTTLLKEITNDTKITKPEELFLNSPTLLSALTFEARNAVEKLTKIDPAFTLLYQSDIDRGVSVRAYTEFFKGQKINDPNGEPTLTINGNTVLKESLPQHLIPGENTLKISSTTPSYLSVILSGYEPVKEPKPQEKFTIQDRKYYRKNLLYKGTPLQSQGTSETHSLRLGETVRVVLKGKISDKTHAHSLLIEELPAGFTYLSGSLRGNHSGARIEGNHLIITYSSVPDNYLLSYTLVASEIGTWYHRPTLLSPSYNVDNMVHNAAQELHIVQWWDAKPPLPAEYVTNAAEHYELAKLHFDDKQYALAKQHIIAYNKLKQSSEDPQLARMLLWIETANETPDAQLLADSFEVLTERAPELIIPFEKILKVGKAYRSIAEHERSTDVYTATLEANFTSESYVSAVLEDQGKFSLSLEYQDALWLQYPDLGEITTSRFELGQQIYTIATDQKKSATLGDNPLTKKPYTEKELTAMSLDYMQGFLTHAPTHKLAADASFSIANALFALKRYQQVVDHTVDAAVTYKDSTHATSFRYMQAVGHYWLRNYDKALAAASKVAQEDSDDQELAAFITAQIYHAKGQPQNAIAWYESIKNKYPDAAQSIAYFEQKSISLDEVKVLNSGDKATLKIKYRNIKEAQFQIYRVDLMKLYLREKNLSNISKINLAGINPKHSLTVKLGDGKDFKQKEKSIELPISKDGAYLVICRGDYLYTSGLMLITPLKMEVQEYPNANSVRVNISDKKTGKYLDSVHVKAVGNDKNKIVSGDTDLRGVWQGDAVHSPSTIIAKDKQGRYAFFRSKLAENTLVRQEINRRAAKPKVDFNQNLKMKQDALNRSNYKNYEQKRRSKGKGVEIKKARKK